MRGRLCERSGILKCDGLTISYDSIGRKEENARLTLLRCSVYTGAIGDDRIWTTYWGVRIEEQCMWSELIGV